ncbi:MAG: hypothetical protein Unbinned4585contig1001_36 [Prokaryotic dsDNA virus sp.]|nr:MAG: hypothetical protein Unbinned4585contig1001_36 [Prokaryotic dsDNA virus sp.]|tara:strand:+ start:2036 stop:2323 length:288 start_codon:yes stop_codon:yes gene_type:complete
MGNSTVELLGEQLGKGSVTIIEDTDSIGAATGVDYYAVHFPVETTIASITTGSNVTGDDADLHRTYAAGTTLFLNFTAITLSGTGLALVYKNDTL